MMFCIQKQLQGRQASLQHIDVIKSLKTKQPRRVINKLVIMPDLLEDVLAETVLVEKIKIAMEDSDMRTSLLSLAMRASAYCELLLKSKLFFRVS